VHDEIPSIILYSSLARSLRSIWTYVDIEFDCIEGSEICQSPQRGYPFGDGRAAILWVREPKELH